MKKIFLAISILALATLPTFGQDSLQLKIATQVYEIIKEKGHNYEFEGDDAVLFKSMIVQCHKSSVSDIEKEAAETGLDRDTYADSDSSMERFNQNLAEHIENIDKFSQPQLLWIMFKSAQRLQIQGGGNSLPKNFKKNLTIARTHISKIAEKLGIYY